MIGYLSGKVVHKDERSLILNVGGVGYKIAALPETLQKMAVGSDATLWTHLAVREDALDLYGFGTEEELSFFKLLISISGIGPKTALGILSATTISTIRRSVVKNDTGYLTKISGIGKKLAEKLVHELKDKIEAGAEDGAGPLQDESDVLEALKSLGYQEREIREVLKKLPASEIGAGNRVKAALKQLGK
jgi:Holliday junction DNA helicase RuvA